MHASAAARPGANVEDPDASPAERTIAAALTRVLHTADPRDLKSLEEIADDPTEPTALRQLAAMVSGIVHVPSETERAAVTRLLSDQP